MYKKVLSILLILHSACSDSMDKPFNPLHKAIAKKNICAVRKLLSHHGELEALDELGQTPLLHAVTSNQLEIAKMLLAAGANPNASLNGRTALHYAAQKQEFYFINLLMKENTLLSMVDNENGFTPLHYAAQHDSVHAVITLCDEGADVTLRCNKGMRPIEVALAYESLHALEILLRYDNRSSDLLRKAVMMNSLDGISLLVKSGIKISNQTPEIQEKIASLFEGKLPPLHRAMVFSTMTAFKDALHTLDVQSEAYANTWNEEYDTASDALILAYSQGLLEHAAKLECFMEKKSISLSHNPRECLSIAILPGHLALCRILLDKITRSKKPCEYGPLFQRAAQLGHHGIVNLLLPKLNLEHELSQAVKARSSTTIEALLQAGAPTNEAEEFLTNPVPKPRSKREEAFFQGLLSRFTMHKEAVHNPPRSSYLGRLSKGIRFGILEPMVKTKLPQESTILPPVKEDNY